MNMVERHFCNMCTKEIEAGSRAFKVIRMRRQDGSDPHPYDPVTTLRRVTVWEHIPCRMKKVAPSAE